MDLLFSSKYDSSRSMLTEMAKFCGIWLDWQTSEEFKYDKKTTVDFSQYPKEQIKQIQWLTSVVQDMSSSKKDSFHICFQYPNLYYKSCTESMWNQEE